MKLLISFFALYFVGNYVIAQKIISFGEKSYLRTLNNYYCLISDSLSVKNNLYHYSDLINIDGLNNKVSIILSSNKAKLNIDILFNDKKIKYNIINEDNIESINFSVRVKNKNIDMLSVGYDKDHYIINNLQNNKIPKYFIVYQKNLLIGKYKSIKDSFAICLSDYQLNGSYDDIYIMPFSTTKIDVEIYGKSRTKYKSSFFIKTNISTYYVNLLTKNINNLFAIRDSASDSMNKLELLDVIPNINIYGSHNDTILLPKLIDNKYLLLDFWMASCIPCVKKHNLIKKYYKLLNEKFTIVSLNYFNTKKEISDYKNLNNYQWPFYSVSESYNREFNQNGFPFGLLFNNQGIFIKYITDLRQLLKDDYGIIERE